MPTNVARTSARPKRTSARKVSLETSPSRRRMSAQQREYLLEYFRTNNCPSLSQMRELSTKLNDFPVDKIDRWFRTERQRAIRYSAKGTVVQDTVGCFSPGSPHQDGALLPSNDSDDISFVLVHISPSTLSQLESFPTFPQQPMSDAEAAHLLLALHHNPVRFEQA